MSKKIVREIESVGTEEMNLTLNDVAELTGMSIRTEPITDFDCMVN